MNDNIITWTPTNWVTVFLMALGGFFILGLVVKGVKAVAAKRGTGATSADTSAS